MEAEESTKGDDVSGQNRIEREIAAEGGRLILCGSRMYSIAEL